MGLTFRLRALEAVAQLPLRLNSAQGSLLMFQYPHSAHEIARSGVDSSFGGVVSAETLQRCIGPTRHYFLMFVAVVWPGGVIVSNSLSRASNN